MEGEWKGIVMGDVCKFDSIVNIFRVDIVI